jgi:hypothetical protein
MFAYAESGRTGCSVFRIFELYLNFGDPAGVTLIDGAASY